MAQQEEKDREKARAEREKAQKEEKERLQQELDKQKAQNEQKMKKQQQLIQQKEQQLKQVHYSFILSCFRFLLSFFPPLLYFITY